MDGCAASGGGAHIWGKPDRAMTQRCACGEERLFPPHKPRYKRIPPPLGQGLLACAVCGYVKAKGSPLGALEAKVHPPQD